LSFLILKDPLEGRSTRMRTEEIQEKKTRKIERSERKVEEGPFLVFISCSVNREERRREGEKERRRKEERRTEETNKREERREKEEKQRKQGEIKLNQSRLFEPKHCVRFWNNLFLPLSIQSV